MRPPSSLSKWAIDKSLSLDATPGAHGGLAPALEVFKTLLRYPMVQPRRQTKFAPPGHTGTIGIVQAQLSLQHLYSDLGVLVFSGLNPHQIRRVSNILTWVTKRGGLGRIQLMLKVPAAPISSKSHGIISNANYVEAIDQTRTGLLRSETLLELASKRFEELIALAEESRPNNSGGYRRVIETSVSIPGIPPRRGVVHYGRRGARQLSVESHAYMGYDDNSGHLAADILFYTPANGLFVGNVSMTYVVLRKFPGESRARTQWANRLVNEQSNNDDSIQSHVLWLICDALLHPLWQLEREVWSRRWEKLQETKEQEKEMEQTRKRERREKEEARQQELSGVLGAAAMLPAKRIQSLRKRLAEEQDEDGPAARWRRARASPRRRRDKLERSIARRNMGLSEAEQQANLEKLRRKFGARLEAEGLKLGDRGNVVRKGARDAQRSKVDKSARPFGSTIDKPARTFGEPISPQRPRAQRAPARDEAGMPSGDERQAHIDRLAKKFGLRLDTHKSRSGGSNDGPNW
ncbi:hypothetical protein S40288_10619 [Stachybotrys chartarum IBT 40288]|nr:hypothetical protein S40288_10619 [Stachybotrys chartarum IBT 40288]